MVGVPWQQDGSTAAVAHGYPPIECVLVLCTTHPRVCRYLSCSELSPALGQKPSRV